MAHPYPPNLWQGIRLVQAGRKAEALPYLRYAARNESLSAEGWLWLAAATDDREEYRHCVQQALGLDPGHPVARQMRQALDAQDAQANGAIGYRPYTPPYAMPGVTSVHGMSPPGYAAGPYGPTGLAVARPYPRRRRRIVAMLLALLAIGAVIGAVLLLQSGTLSRWVNDLGGGSQEANVRPEQEIVVGAAPGFRFRMQLPPGWRPADTDDPAWVAARETLAAAFGSTVEGSVWQQVSAAFSAVKRDPVYGQMVPSARVVDADESRLRAYGAVTALSLDAIKAFPAAILAQMPEVCDRMRAIEDDYSVESNGVTVIEARIVDRGDDSGCALVVERSITDSSKIIFPVTRELAPETMREVVIAVPVNEERYALWRLTLAEDAYTFARDDIERLIETLVFVGE